MKHSPSKNDIAGALPVRPASFAVLAALADGAKPGFAVLEAIDQTVPGHPILGAGTLYRLLRELRRDGWIERTSADKSDKDERRQYHVLTRKGRAILHAEATRLRRTLNAAGLLSHQTKGSAS